MKFKGKKLSRRIIGGIVSLVMLTTMIPAAVFAAEGDVARIGETMYTSLDEAIAAATDGATIEVLSDATTSGINLSKNLTIKGADGLAEKPVITFTDNGIALWGKTLTLENCDVVMNGIGSTPYVEWTWMAICASKDAILTLNNVEMTMDGDPDESGTNLAAHAIYFCQNNQLNLNNSTLVIEDYQQDALEWDGGDGGYNINFTNSTFISDHNRSGFAGSFVVTAKNSRVDVINSTGNGSNGSAFIFEDSTVNFNNNHDHGLSASNLTIKNSVVNGNNNGRYGVTYTGNMTMDGTSVLTTNGNASIAGGGLRAANSSSVSTVASGAVMNIKDNLHNGLENYGSFTFEDGAKLTATGNDERTTNGGGIYNGGTMALPENAVVMNNHAFQTGGGICNAGTITIPESVKLYNNHADQAGDDLYNRASATAQLPAIGNGWALDGGEDCNGEEHLIDGWYDDSENARWMAHAEDPTQDHIVQYTDTQVSGVMGLKAAHGKDYKDKTSYPGLDKQVQDNDTQGWDQDAVGADAEEVLNFKLVSNVPSDLRNYLKPEPVDPPEIVPAAAEPNSGVYMLTFHDQMDPALTFNPDSVVVKIGENVLTPGTDYTLVLDPADDCTFEISMDLAALYEAGKITDADIDNATPIEVSYNATLSGDVINGTYPNTAWVTYEGGQTEEDIVTVNTYAINIFKFDQADNAGLSGAEFELYQKDAEGNTIEESVIELTSGNDGYVIAGGLDDGTYYLKETQAPDGYVCSSEELEIVIAAGSPTTVVVQVQFANSQIPHTGGIGTTLFTIGGAAIIVGAGVVFAVTRKRKKVND